MIAISLLTTSTAIYTPKASSSPTTDDDEKDNAKIRHMKNGGKVSWFEFQSSLRSVDSFFDILSIKLIACDEGDKNAAPHTVGSLQIPLSLLLGADPAKSSTAVTAMR